MAKLTVIVPLDTNEPIEDCGSRRRKAMTAIRERRIKRAFPTRAEHEEHLVARISKCKRDAVILRKKLAA